MKAFEDDPFEVLVIEHPTDELSSLTKRPAVLGEPAVQCLPSAATARFHGFGLYDEPLLVGVPGLAGHVVAARTTVSLRREQIGSTVVVVFEEADVRRPIILGVVQSAPLNEERGPTAPLVAVQLDDDRLVLTAEREVVLRCGEASVTLTRAGKVVIKGTYVLSRSSGYNRIKGAAVDIN